MFFFSTSVIYFLLTYDNKKNNNFSCLTNRIFYVILYASAKVLLLRESVCTYVELNNISSDLSAVSHIAPDIGYGITKFTHVVGQQ